MKPTATILSIAIVLVQIFDIAIHAATDQLEPLRVTSNVVVFVWLVLTASGKISAYVRQIDVASVGVYLLLNALFLSQAGLMNPAQGGAVRWMLLVLVTLTLTLALWLTYTRHPSK